VIIRMDLGLLPLAELIRLRRQGLQG
jgi:hypothetical protein